MSFRTYFLLISVLLSLLTQFTWKESSIASTAFSKQTVLSNSVLDKITFDISQVSPEGLVGASNNARSLSYEFCIPANETALAEVQAIDPTIDYYAHSAGRIGCTRQQYLCIGNTHNSQWREILLAIASLDYVQQIDEFFGE